MDNPNSLWAVLAILISTVGGVVAAWIGSRERRQEVEVPAEAPELVGADLQTISGLASAVTQLSSAHTAASTRIAQLEEREGETRERLAALWRYIRLLRSTIRGLGGVVPEPEREDRRHLIEQ
ncbi:hypothetical protein [Streptomyces sp. NPDC005548]|jgi:hypothetical protein|uniref:hypothetical protein n=1 Tax=Streptomyces sp. NPDC005548 TaxID=3364724 RepID=UPI0036D11F50